MQFDTITILTIGAVIAVYLICRTVVEIHATQRGTKTIDRTVDALVGVFSQVREAEDMKGYRSLKNWIKSEFGRIRERQDAVEEKLSLRELDEKISSRML